MLSDAAMRIVAHRADAIPACPQPPGCRATRCLLPSDHGGMRHRIALPPTLGHAFSVQEAAALGIRRGRRDAPDLARPFHGVRTLAAPETFSATVSSAAPRLRPGQRLSGRTALRHWGLPVADRWHPGEPLEIAVPTDRTPPRAAGVRGTRLARGRAKTWRVNGIPVVDPVAAVFTSASQLDLVGAVVLLDALLATSDNYPGLRPGRPTVSAFDIAARLVSWGPFPGCATIRAALSHARGEVESPKETETRMLITSAGLPEPVIQHEVRADGRLIARSDLAYPELRIAIEYEGDGHRTDQHQWRTDIRRQRELEGRGWIVIRLTQHDLGAGAASFLERLRLAIVSRSRR